MLAHRRRSGIGAPIARRKNLALLCGHCAPRYKFGPPCTTPTQAERFVEGHPRPWGGVENLESFRSIRSSKTLPQADNTLPPYGAAIPDSDSHIPTIGALVPLNGNRNSDNGNRIPASDNPIPVNDKKFTLITGRRFRKFSEFPCFWRHASRFLKEGIGVRTLKSRGFRRRRWG